jgi:hypothetical protein
MDSLSKLTDELNAALGEELKRRLTKGNCEHCGRSAASHQELTVIRQWISDNDVASARQVPPLRSVISNMPFSEPDEKVRSKTA